ncbi:hypothetical protein [Acinetobacter nectaris]|uniref:hypothetical protein n=1 Tax=Acinetobacter nectaris TaxID=1219382 RepID=UPI001F25317D|nr:hypothetical protein [Acinetobacter nectaris]MCF9045360.1 hypothetical protein [Acinetobacter nectaris]
MNMEYTHKTDYFFFAHKFIRFLETYLQQHPDERVTVLNLNIMDDIFSHDFASTTVNLDSILNIVDEYHLTTNEGAKTLIHHHDINLKKHLLTISFNDDAVRCLQAGQAIHYPNVA